MSYMDTMIEAFEMLEQKVILLPMFDGAPYRGQVEKNGITVKVEYNEKQILTLSVVVGKKSFTISGGVGTDYIAFDNCNFSIDVLVKAFIKILIFQSLIVGQAHRKPYIRFCFSRPTEQEEILKQVLHDCKFISPAQAFSLETLEFDISVYLQSMN